jgi:hypothetical protein
MGSGVGVTARGGTGIPVPSDGGPRFAFEVDATGRVARTRFGENFTERIESWEDC